MTTEEQLSTPAPIDTPAPDLGSADVDTEMGAAWDKVMADDTPEDTSSPSRGADGRFAAKTAESSLEGDTGAESAIVPQTDIAVSAPEHLPQAIKNAWGAIPKDAQDALVAYQSETGKKFAEVGRKLEQVQPVADVLSNALAQMPGFQGRTVQQIAQGAAELAAVQHQLETGSPEQKAQLIGQIAQMYGVQLGQGQAQSSGNTDVTLLQNRIQQLEAQIKQSNPEETVYRVMEERAISEQVSAVSKDMPFFADVQDDMVHFISRVKASDPGISVKDAMTKAYDMATNANPEVRQKIRELEASKATASENDTKRKEAAKKAASINVKPASSGKAPVMSEEDAMGSAYDRLMA